MDDNFLLDGSMDWLTLIITKRFSKVSASKRMNQKYIMYFFNFVPDEALLQEDIMELMPSVEQANSISEDLDKKMKFELMIVSPEARGELTGRSEVGCVNTVTVLCYAVQCVNAVTYVTLLGCRQSKYGKDCSVFITIVVSVLYL
jgi:hypothetical protein